MISLKRIIYHIDEATTNEGLYISIKELIKYFYDEDLDDEIIYNRIRSQLNKNSNLFLKKKETGKYLYKLSSSGYRYLKKFKDNYNVITEEIEVF